MSDVPVITEVEGVKTTLPAEAVADLKPEPASEPAQVEETKPEAKPENPAPEPVKPEPAKEPVPEPVKDPEGKFKPKPKPIAKLLEKAHIAEERAAAAEAKAADLEVKLASVATKPAAEASADIKALAEKHNIDENVLADIVAAARAGVKVELPKEVQDLVVARREEQEQQAEISAFNTRVDRLASTFKDEPIGEHRDKLLELAYSTDKAPDGEPYFQKELAELYFGYVKPEIEPGKKTAEPSRGGTAASEPVLDFEAIQNDPVAIEKMDDATFKKFSIWMQEHQKGSPMQRAK